MDIKVENHGSIVLVRPLTEAAETWIEENVSNEAQWFGGGLVVEHRFLENLLGGMVNAGLTL